MRFVGRGVSLELYRPAGTPRLSLLVAGLYTDGWLAHGGRLTVWPDSSGRTDGTLTLRLWLPKDTQLTPMIFTAPGLKRTVHVPSGGSRTVVFHPSGNGPVGAPLPHHEAPLSERRPRDQRQARRAASSSAEP